MFLGTSLAQHALGWLRLRKDLFQNLSLVGVANAAIIGSSLIAVYFNTRGLGATQFGIFAVIQAYAALLGTIFTCETWQTVCRLGADKRTDITHLCHRGMMIDAVAAVAAFATSIIVLDLWGSYTGVPERAVGLASMYCLSLLAGLGGTAKGYFRLLDRFDILAMNQFVNAGLIAIASVVLWYANAGLFAYILVFTVIAALYKLQLFVQLLLHLHVYGGERNQSEQPIRTSFFRLAQLSLGVSVLSTFVNNRKNVALLTVSALLGETVAGLFSAALKCTAPLTKGADITNQVVFSSVVRSFRQSSIEPTKRRKLRILTLAMLASMIAAASLVAIFAGQLVDLFLNNQFAGAAPILALLLFVEALQLAGIHFNPIFQTRNATALLTLIYFASSAAFVVGAIAMRESLTALSAGWLLVALSVVTYLTQYALVFRPRGLLAEARH